MLLLPPLDETLPIEHRCIIAAEPIAPITAFTFKPADKPGSH